ncbi:MAG TPA: YncE family protein [Bryobacteraceae bacterium]|nr:YncE family protein [Bryobacteraceae bacterium]
MYRIILALLVLSVAFAQSGYHQIKKITIGGEGGWDYLIADAGRVYVSHTNEVDVVDSIKGEVAGKITGLHGVHGIALVPEFNRGYISNGQSNTVTIFDLKTLAKIGDDVPAGKNPDAIMYDPASKRVFAFNGRSNDATAINAKDGTVAGTIALEGKPEFAAADGKGHVYVNIEDKSAVYDIDAKTLTVSHKWPLAPCEEPSGMAMNPKTRRIFSGCGNKMMAVTDADSGKVVATPAICNGIDATAFDPALGWVFHSCGEGIMTVIKEDSPDKYTLVENVKTQQSARTMALDTKTHNVFLSIAEFEAAAPTAPATDGKTPPRPRRRIVPGSFAILEFGK